MVMAASLQTIGIALILSHGRQWYFTAFEKVCGTMFTNYSYYGTALATLALAYPALAITLRDKKLITKTTEQVVIGTCTIPWIAITFATFNVVGGIGGILEAW